MTSVDSAQRLLDNVVWHAIDGPCAALAERSGHAGRFHREVAPFSGLCDDPNESAWNDLARIIGEGKIAFLFTPALAAPDGWAIEGNIPCFQMLADNVTDATTEHEFMELGPADVPEMLDLVAATEPGPFGSRTIEFGGYLGYRDNGRLVAMTGERLHCPGFTEVSAVCVADDYRGRGLARKLVLAVVGNIRARGEEAFLHVMQTNTPAYNLYLDLGFTVRTEADAAVFRHQG